MRYVLFVLLYFLVALYEKGQTNTFPPSGSVGIGTTSPVGKLDINQAGAQLRLSGGTIAGGVWTSATEHLYLADWNTGTKGLLINMSSGNVGIGTASPGAKLSFSDLTGSAAADGITWYSPSPLDYGIFKTSGSWNAPNYQQLKLNWATGIILDPGSSYGKSFVEVGGGGLRVTSGNVGIGTTNPLYRLQVNSNQAGNLRLVSNGSTTPNPTIDIFDNVNGTEFVLSPSTGKVDMFTYSNHALALGTANTERMRIDNNGNVGIGVTNPTSKLHIADGAGGEQLRFSRGMGAVRFAQGLDRDDLYLHNRDASKTFMFWREDGNVGIGTNVPDQTLTIKGGIGLYRTGTSPTTSSAGFIKYVNGMVLGNSSVSDPLSLQTNSIDRLFIQNNGNVGIGTTDPGSFKLAVNGKTWSTEVQVAVNRPPDYVFEPTYDLKPLAEIETYIKENKHLPEVPSAKEMEKNGVQLGEMNMLLLKKVEELTLYVIELKKRDEAQQKEIEQLKIKK